MIDILERYDPGHFHDSIDAAGDDHRNGNGVNTDGSCFAKLSEQLAECRTLDNIDANEVESAA